YLIFICNNLQRYLFQLCMLKNSKKKEKVATLRGYTFFYCNTSCAPCLPLSLYIYVCHDIKLRFDIK
ncbi:hypothetical protein BpHYR1_034064, partial [Brachionus plicatilis]